MKIAYFAHSLASCWNNGNAHFQRGVLRELIHAGHEVCAYEPEGAWSLANLVSDHGEAALAAYRKAYPELSSTAYAVGDDLARLIDGCDAVIVHEWNEPWVLSELAGRRRHGQFTLLFHDTHHRAVSDPASIRHPDLPACDGILAFGHALAEVYRGWGWGDRAFVWHEAADTRLFRPPDVEDGRHGFVWVGNWGDGERSEELTRFLLGPAASSGEPLAMWGVRYPDAALMLIAQHGASYRGWLANAQAPEVYAQHLATVHVPRQYYASRLAGIPTIRVFEALACGIPLICAPWHDTEGLFEPGKDYLIAESGDEMAEHMIALRHDPALRRVLAGHGLATIRNRHSCAHRAAELVGIIEQAGGRSRTEAAA